MNASEDKSDFLDLTVDPLSLEDAERRGARVAEHSRKHV